MLENLRQETLVAHRYDTSLMPTAFAYARASHPQLRFPMVRFGVTAPRTDQIGSETWKAAEKIRQYRIRQCWGDQIPPPKEEIWGHGHCAEAQAFPPIVDWCERLGLENVVIFSLAMHKSGVGRLYGMCRNCLLYIIFRVIWTNPSWKVIDVATGQTYSYAQLQLQVPSLMLN
jgi:hypothetical protein